MLLISVKKDCAEEWCMAMWPFVKLLLPLVIIIINECWGAGVVSIWSEVQTCIWPS